MSDAIAYLSRAIEQGRGLEAADLVLKGGRIFDLVSGELVKSDVAICGDRIVGTMSDYRGAREIDVAGKIVVPGFIDTHLHVESSLITPLEFDRCVLRARRHHGDLRSARDRQRARRDRPALFPRRLDGDRDGPAGAIVELRAGDRISRPPARGSRSTISCRSPTIPRCSASPNS